MTFHIGCPTNTVSEIWQRLLLLLSCAKSHMFSASQRQPHLLHVSTVDPIKLGQWTKVDDV